MSALTEDVLRRIQEFMRSRKRLEKNAASELRDLYERARTEVLQDLLEQFSELSQMDLQRVETILREIDRLLQSYTHDSAALRTNAITASWEAGQRLAAGVLATDPSLAAPLIGLQGYLGMVNHDMVGALFGNVPQLAGKVTADALERIRHQLVISAVKGESIPQMARRIAGTGLTQEGLKRPFKTLDARATLIARTESIKGADAGYHDMVNRAQQLVGEEIHDLWLTAQDGRVEAECLSIAAGGADGGVPGHPGVYYHDRGPRPVISTHPGCRCRRVPVLLRWIRDGLINLPEIKAA